MAREQGSPNKNLEDIKQEIQAYRNRSDARALILAGLTVFLLGTLAPDETLAGKVAEKAADVVSIGLYVGAVLKLAGVSITDTGRRAINSIKRQK